MINVTIGKRQAAILVTNHDQPFSCRTALPKIGSFRKLRVNKQTSNEIVVATSMAAHHRDATAIAPTTAEKTAVTAQTSPVETILSDTSARTMGGHDSITDTDKRSLLNSFFGEGEAAFEQEAAEIAENSAGRGARSVQR